MKVYIGTDLEGVAGVTGFDAQAYPEGRYYEEARRLLTGEVNAAVEALVAAGVEDILVVDGHGVGAMSFVDLHPAAKLLHGRPGAPREVRDEVARQYDVCMMIGQHAMAGTVDGTLNHTQSEKTVDYYKLNGMAIGEIAQFALYQGALGLPLIFLSGDHAACREVEQLIPGVTTAAVKQGLGRSSAISLSARVARERIGAGVAAAVVKQRQEPLPPLAVPGPYVLEVRFFHTDSADAVTQRRVCERVDSQTIRVRGDDIRDVIYL